MKHIVDRIQKDFNQFQKKLKKEGDDMLKTLRAMANDKRLQDTKVQVTKMIESKLKTFEPALDKFVKEVQTKAKKMGIDVGDIERRVTKAAESAFSNWTKAKKSTTSTIRNKVKVVKVATAKKAPAKKKAAAKKKA